MEIIIAIAIVLIVSGIVFISCIYNAMINEENEPQEGINEILGGNKE